MIVATARDAADLLAPLFTDSAEERVVVLLLDPQRRLLGIERMTGGADEAALPVRAIVKAALDLDASVLVLAHCHPSGDPQPSRADIEATRRLAAAAAELDLRLEDHLIFAGGECASLRQLGLV